MKQKNKFKLNNRKLIFYAGTIAIAAQGFFEVILEEKTLIGVVTLLYLLCVLKAVEIDRMEADGSAK